MPGIICHHQDRFFLWNKERDAPLTYSMTREELEALIKEEEGEKGLRELPRRIERALGKGTSSLMHASLEDMLKGNRAGPDESEVPAGRLLRAILAGEDPVDIPASECLGHPWDREDDDEEAAQQP